jgi:hypothetical protein
MSEDTHRKTRASFYTPDRVRAARENVEAYEWAARQRDEVVAAADAVLDRGLDALWEQVTGQGIPRSFDPGDGTARNRWSPVEGEPWTITDGDVVLPTNDFAAYRESGRDERGFFDADLADDSLLVNERSPDRPRDWGVDDGFGWTDEAGGLGTPGTRYVPVAFWNHWGGWYGVSDDVQALRDAYLYTGEAAYARAASVLLDRIADVYPEMDVAAYPDPPFHNSHGSTGQGRIIGSIWETNHVREFAAAYDAVFDGQDDDLVSFLTEKARAYESLPPKDSLGAIRENIEERFVTELLPAVEAAEVRGNLGMHQSALAMAGVVMDEPEGYTRDALEFVFQAGGLRSADGDHWDVSDGDYDAQLDREWVVTGGNVGPALVDVVDRDGYGNEAAPNYNAIIQNALRRIADILASYDRLDELDVDADLYAHPKFPRILAAHRDLTLLGRYTPSIGDSGKVGDPGLELDLQTQLAGFGAYGDSAFAQTAHLVNGESTDELHGDVFDEAAGTLADRVSESVDAHGPLSLDSTLLPAYGFAALRSGAPTPDGDCRRALTTYFGRNSGDVGGSTTHTHQDALSIELYAHGLNLAPDLGYPEKTAAWPKAVYWTKNTVSHNTVVVDECRQQPHRVGTPHLFGDDGQVGVVDVSAPRVYPQTDCYRRTTALVDVDETASYAVDVFRVAGGSRHDYSFHGAEGDLTTQGLSLDPQASGTYAGPTVPVPESGEVTEYDEEVGSGFNYLSNVARDEGPDSPFTATWDVVDTWGVRDDGAEDVELRVTMLGEYDDVSLADGAPPANKAGNPDTLRYLLARRLGEDLRSAFTSVIEPTRGSSRIRSIATVPVRDPAGEVVSPFRARAVRVELDTGRTDFVVSTSEPSTRFVVGERLEVRGRFAVCSERDGEPTYARLLDGTRVHHCGTGRTLVDRTSRDVLAGDVVDFTRELARSNQITVEVSDGRSTGEFEAAVGRHVFIDAADSEGWNGVYAVEGISVEGNRVHLDVGDATTVRRYRDAGSPEDGYEYVVSTGSAARVPADVTWRVGG